MRWKIQTDSGAEVYLNCGSEIHKCGLSDSGKALCKTICGRDLKVGDKFLTYTDKFLLSRPHFPQTVVSIEEFEG